MKVILISGKAEAGKTTTADILRNHILCHTPSTVVTIPYGNYVKETAREIYCWDGEKDEKGRALLQWWGTDYVRTRFPNFWAETVVRLAEVIKDDINYLIIDDVRFPNEITCWDRDIYDVTTVRVERPGHKSKLTPEQLIHESETALDDFYFDVILVATNMDELVDEVNKKLIPKIY